MKPTVSLQIQLESLRIPTHSILPGFKKPNISLQFQTESRGYLPLENSENLLYVFNSKPNHFV